MQLDWRPLLPRISIPCLNVVGRLSATFPWEGSAVVGQLIPNCHTVRPFLISASPLRMLLSSRTRLLVHATLQRVALQQKKETQLALTLSESVCMSLHLTFGNRVRLLQVFFEQGNHFLYIEEPEKFNQLVIDFAEKGLSAVSSKCSV